ncbi:unnamed protein product [Cladocopium goreaui]|uniref:Uncharacterized protein n=1 Tax=Cladocopium goreaui TaxID=2562237 RepID=A0A9P1BRJ2_9DINO|nr:unnamed protein product [Cladocopium goreaui]
MPDGNIKNRVLNISKPVLKQYLQQYQEQEPCAASQMLQTLPSKMNNLPKQLRMTFEKMEFVRLDHRLMATPAAMPTRVTKRSVTMKFGILQDLSLRDAVVLCPRNHDPESIQDAKADGRLEMLALADADPDSAADALIVKPKLKASGQKSKVPEVASVLDDLKKKLADRKNGITEEKPEKDAVPQRKAKDKKKPVPEDIPAPPLKRSIQEVVKYEEAKKPASVQKKPARTKKSLPSKVKTPHVPKKQEPRPIPAWWNDKEELLKSFPEDTDKRFASRCYHFVKKNEMRKGVSKDLATLIAQRAHQEAKDRWLKLSSRSVTMATVDNTLGDTQLYPDQPGGGEEQPDQEAEEPAEEVQPAEEAAPSAPSVASVEADPTNRVTKKGHATLSCKTCHNVTSMLYKCINMQTVGFKDIPPAQAADFFQKAGQLCEKYGSHVKGLLQDKLVEQEMLKQTVAVHGKFLPLSVWEQKGFDTERIKQNAEKQRSDIFDWVYRVPILEISHEKVTEKVRQRLLQAERKVGKRKASQQMEDEDVVDLEVDTKAKSKTKKVPQEKKDEAKKANAVVLGNARKTIRLLDPVAKEAKKACKDGTARMISKRRRKGF